MRPNEDLELAVVFTVPRLLTVARVATVLECSPRTVRRRIHDGALPAVLEGDRTMVRGDDLARYIESLTRTDTHTVRRRSPKPRQRSYDFLS